MTIYSGDNVEYTKGDSFCVEVLCEEGFEEGDILEFSVSPTEKSANIINKRIPLSEGKFYITLNDDEISRLAISSYVYKVSVESELSGRITHKSGEFLVKWGA